VVPVEVEETVAPEVGPPSLPDSVDQMTPIGTTREYIVQKGDSAATIAKHFGVTVRAITEANATSMLRLKVGQRLLIPETVQ
jgi:LysM repeat protein